MPTILFHLNVAKEFANKYKKLDTPNFYLGVIAPDSVNLNGFADKSLRWLAHARAKDLKEWKENIIKFYNDEKGSFSIDYLLGYVIHVLTDIVVDEMYYKEGEYEKIVRSGILEDDAFKYFKNQIVVYEHSQLNKEWWKDVKKSIKEANAITINNLDSKLINDWKEKILIDYDSQNYEDYNYITPNTVEICVNKVENILKEAGTI